MDTNDVKYIPQRHPIQRVAPELKAKFIRAQSNLVETAYSNAADILANALQDLKLDVGVPEYLRAVSVLEFVDRPFNELYAELAALLQSTHMSPDVLHLHSLNLCQRVQLIRAFEAPDDVVALITHKVAKIVKTFPRTASDIERGRNPGDVLDPFIVTASRILMYGGNFTRAIAATVSHKALMIIEGLLGHLHEDVIASMRGNVRTPEPRGFNQEILDVLENPFPGADIVQPPYSKKDRLRFHQVKSKTGSAKGGDGRRLGDQLQRLQQYYGGEIYYNALIGNTLKGHRSRRGVESTAPRVVVLVGDAAFTELTHSRIGPQLLLRVYQNAFSRVARESGYEVDTLAEGIVETFRSQMHEAGEDYLDIIMEKAVNGPRHEQDSRCSPIDSSGQSQ